MGNYVLILWGAEWAGGVILRVGSPGRSREEREGGFRFVKNGGFSGIKRHAMPARPLSTAGTMSGKTDIRAAALDPSERIKIDYFS